MASDVPDDLAADLAALADGQLDAGRRREVEARLEADPDLRAAFERQRDAARAIVAAAAAVEAPHDLRLRVDALGSAKPAAGRGRRRWFPFAGLATAALAAAAAVVIVTGSGGLTLDGVLAAATLPPVAAVSIDPIDPRMLRDQIDGVRFPNYAAKFGWKAAGARSDKLDGRRTRTVFYEKDGRRIAYTIVAGELLDWEGRFESRRGVKLWLLDSGVVMWERNGHTCVLSGADEQALAELAVWKPKGAV